MMQQIVTKEEIPKQLNLKTMVNLRKYIAVKLLHDPVYSWKKPKAIDEH